MARGRVTVNSSTPIVVAASSVYPKTLVGSRKLSHGLIKNVGSSTVYLQWTEEDDTLDETNGWPLEADASLSLQFDRAGKSLSANVQAMIPSGSTTIVYAFE
jgi:hypothetical protein